MKRIAIIVLVLVAALGAAAGGLAWAMGLFAEQPDIQRETTPKETKKQATIDDALELIHKARDNFAGVKDYQCTYLRDEMVGREMKKNHIILSIRHEPFSVCMEYVSPNKGRKAAYVHGKNDNQIILKNVPLMKKIDPAGAFAMSQSRHKITEAGLKGMIERFCSRWAEEKKLGLTEVLIQDVELKVALPEGDRVRPCWLVQTTHPTRHKDFIFYRASLYIDKETGLPVRMQGYDWPKDENDKEGTLVEDYTYLDLKTNIGLKDEHFSWEK
jgi:Protein of unknown function (DUF1571)